MEITNKRKAEEDQQEQPEEKNRKQHEERGVKRSTDDWETFAKDLKAGAERKSEGRRRTKRRRSGMTWATTR